ncbi:MAG: twin-arginine translocase TatA/TatE family subunit [Halobacteriovoraceae bacterium]|nr:twin-arginine translocase TatA/TatE family subunit [Halobacteriovoraceae bacterium]
MFGLGIGEILIILVVLVVFFGAKRLPQMGGSLGKALKNFKKEVTRKDDEIEDKSDRDD